MPGVVWYRSLRWRLTLSFVALLLVLLAVAGTVEYTLLRQAIISTRAEAMRTVFNDAHNLMLREQRFRRGRGRAPLSAGAMVRQLVAQIASDQMSAEVFGPDLTRLASASPGTGSHPAARTGVTLPRLSRGELLAASQFDTIGQPALLGSGPKEVVAMVFPLANAAGTSLGAVEVVEPAVSIRQELGRARLVLGLGALAVLLVALGIGLWVTSRSLRRLGRLTEAARELGRGRLSSRSGLTPGGDEVGVLAGVFDQMAEGVERTVALREEATRQMSQFIADASHELRTPLTAIKGYLEVLRRGASHDPEVLDRALPVMAAEAERMRRLVTDLLALARAESSRTVELRAVDVGKLVREFLEERGLEPGAGIQEGLTAQADPDALLTVLGNLQANAERHGGGKAITWSAYRRGAEVGFTCADAGEGISPEDLPHLFERFFRADAARSRDDGGSGLGLAIVKSLVEAQGGRVEVSSEPGRGAAFTVLLRASGTLGWVPPGRAAAPGSRAAPSRGRPGRRPPDPAGP